jgi:hypothetical protein
MRAVSGTAVPLPQLLSNQSLQAAAFLTAHESVGASRGMFTHPSRWNPTRYGLPCLPLTHPSQLTLERSDPKAGEEEGKG